MISGSFTSMNILRWIPTGAMAAAFCSMHEQVITSNCGKGECFQIHANYFWWVSLASTFGRFWVYNANRSCVKQAHHQCHLPRRRLQPKIMTWNIAERMTRKNTKPIATSTPMMKNAIWRRVLSLHGSSYASKHQLGICGSISWLTGTSTSKWASETRTWLKNKNCTETFARQLSPFQSRPAWQIQVF